MDGGREQKERNKYREGDVYTNTNVYIATKKNTIQTQIQIQTPTHTEKNKNTILKDKQLHTLKTCSMTTDTVA